MRVFDEKFRNNKARYILQCSLATLSVFILLLFLGALSNISVVVGWGASSFIAFTMPHAQVSRPRYMIGGYIVGIATGWLFYRLSLMPLLTQLPFIQEFPLIVFSALSLGVAIFVMVITNLEHPPAASLALGLVLNGCNFTIMVVLLVGIISLSGIKAGLRPVLIDLL